MSELDLNISLNAPGLADGNYRAKCPKGELICLFWANEEGALANYTSFAVIPLQADGSGICSLRGGRAIPPEATHVCAVVCRADYEELTVQMVEIPASYLPKENTGEISGEDKPSAKIVLMSDIHMRNKPGRFRHAFSLIKDADWVLFPGDLANDGREDQYEFLKTCITEMIPDIPVFSVSGNHDTGKGDSVCYRNFEAWLRQRQGDRFRYMDSDTGAFAVSLNQELDLIGLNPNYIQKNFFFPEKGEQLKWMKNYLEHSSHRRHIIMCHAPLLAHNPQRDGSKKAPYIAQDSILQNQVEEIGNVVFLSGHTHVSPIVPCGCVEYDKNVRSLYINDGSVCPSDLKTDEPVIGKDWGGGCFTELNLFSNRVEVVMRQAHTGMRIARGYYRILL